MLYDSLKFVHVLAVVAWVGGSIMVTLLAAQATRQDPAVLAPVARLGAGTGSYLGAAAGIAFLAGIAMMLTSTAPAWEEPWIAVGIVVFFISSFLGPRVINPRFVALADAADAGESGAILTARQALFPMTILDLTLLLIAIAAMIFRWGS